MSNFKQGGRAMDKEYKVGVDVGSTTVKIVLLDGENNILFKKYQRHYSDVKKSIVERAMDKEYKVGVDVGSTTVKIVLLDGENNILFKKYQRHYSDVKKSIVEVLNDVYKIIGDAAGSTTVKIVLLDGENNILFKKYQRHYSDVKKSIVEVLNDVYKIIGDAAIKIIITGSGGIGVSKKLGIKFVQEVISSTKSIEYYHPETDVVVELGGEDAKVTYITGGIDQRMNGICAGGTGAFIDQMATLLKTDAAGLNELAKDYDTIYPIASRCGVFAKTDIQPLINDGAKKTNIAMSIFNAVVVQTVSVLSCGRKIEGNVAFLGGPLYFLSELRQAFKNVLNLDDEHIIFPENAQLYITDIQPLINDGAKKTNIAMSIFNAVVVQTVSVLSCGRKIEGNVAFLGGPLYFLSELRQAFKNVLNLDDEHIIFPENAQLYIAIGAALLAEEEKEVSLKSILESCTISRGRERSIFKINIR